MKVTLVPTFTLRVAGVNLKSLIVTVGPLVTVAPPELAEGLPPELELPHAVSNALSASPAASIIGRRRSEVMEVSGGSAA
jgi:hypothetical protein